MKIAPPLEGRLRENVLREHSLDKLTGRLLAVLRTGELPDSPHPPAPSPMN